jgi:hypothetical protein
MQDTKELPLIILARSMDGDAPDNADPKVTFELEAETGQLFEATFSLRGILSMFVMVRDWSPLRDELSSLPPRGLPGRKG